MKTTKITNGMVIAALKALGITPEEATLNDITAVWMSLKDKVSPNWERFGLSQTRTGGRVLNAISATRAERISDLYCGGNK